jgi:hypothetical protein
MQTRHFFLCHDFLTFVTGDRCYDFKNIFAEKNCKKLAFLTQSKAKLCKILIMTLVFEKNANFFAENWEKSQKIVIITSIPGLLTARQDLKSGANVMDIFSGAFNQLALFAKTSVMVFFTD